MTGFERGDVVTALLPFYGRASPQASSDPRPVERRLQPEARPRRRLHDHYRCGEPLAERPPIIDLPATGLFHASAVRWKVFALPERLLARRIGIVGSVDRSEIAARQAAILA